MGNLVGTLKQAVARSWGRGHLRYLISGWASPEYSGSSRLGFLYTLVTCVDKNPRLIGEFGNVRIG